MINQKDMHHHHHQIAGNGNIGDGQLITNNNDDDDCFLLIPTDSSLSSSLSSNGQISPLTKTTNKNDDKAVIPVNVGDINQPIMTFDCFSLTSQQSFPFGYDNNDNLVDLLRKGKASLITNQGTADDQNYDQNYDHAPPPPQQQYHQHWFDSNKQTNHVHHPSATSTASQTSNHNDNNNDDNDNVQNDFIMPIQTSIANFNKPRPPPPKNEHQHSQPLITVDDSNSTSGQHYKIAAHPRHSANSVDCNDSHPFNHFQQQPNQFIMTDKNTDGKNILQLDHPPIDPLDFLELYRQRNNNEQSKSPSSFLSDVRCPSESQSITNSTVAILSPRKNRKNKKQNNNNNDDDDEKSSTNDDSSTTADSSSVTIDNDTDKSAMERGQWSGKLDFIFSCISYAVGLGNVWRFPYLCYENGGGAFLFPYLICIFVIGVPLFLMEVSLGQYFHAGGVSIWNQIPILKGVGFASMIMIGLCNTYYIVIIAWTLYYLFSSLRVPLPWMSCDNPWNTLACWISDKDGLVETPSGSLSPAQEFWARKALNISGDMAEVGQVQWHLFATLILAWILVYIVIYKGIHQSGKIIWVMAMFPYVILTILFGYGLSLPGAFDGISFYITPQWHMLKEAKIWVAAGTQLLFTYGIGIGTNIALGSYNPTNHNFYRDSLIACLLSSFTSLFSGFVIFSVLGHMAYTMNANIADVARSGPGLAFIVYPEAVTRLPLPNLWAILFFGMLLVLGIDSQFCTVESFVTGIVDEWPHLLRPHRKLFTLFVVLVHLILGISMITSGGMYVFQLMDNFSASGITLIVVVLFELVAFGWIYGGKRIHQNMVEMLDFKPTRLLYYIWCYISPACLLGILIFSIIDYKAPEYAGKPFPWYGELFGFCIASVSIILIPIYMIYYLFIKSDSNLSWQQRLMNGFRPIDEQADRSASKAQMIDSDSPNSAANNNNNDNVNDNNNNNNNVDCSSSSLSSLDKQQSNDGSLYGHNV
ncbi:sodium- and chloride-dependent GABA transporter 1-like [Dermatophagoides pteronyssinus]|uniref:sodium- and chloride-dependent GABA transporter 1-like n=1 Tax=Dermatophagoides pteronyssinus TaxID=6956 RepID=UPI003F66FF77